MISKTKRFNKKQLVLGVASALALSLSSNLLADDTEFTVDIKKQNAGSALLKLSKMSGVQIVLPREIGANIQLPAIKGQYTVESALKSMLSGTGLTYEYASENAIVIKEADNGGSQSEEADEEVVVTGSRIRNTKQVNPVTVITRETIEKRGFSSVEDILRSLPQNQSTMNATRSVQQPVGGDGLPVAGAAQGEFAANLRNLGQSATLVLINGRRTAGSSAFSGSVVNLSNIPAASIERVEILTDSAAAVYGSDAIAGVVNIITRKNYTGATTTARYENAVNGGNKYQLDQVFGFNWDGGQITGTLSVSETKPIVTEKTGYVTNDYRSRGGIDNRNDRFTQPGNVSSGVIELFPGFFIGTNPLGALPTDFDGTDWTVDDLSLANVEAAFGDIIPFEQSSNTENKQADLNFTQEIGESAEIFGTVRYSSVDTESLGGPSFLFGALIPASNPFNNVGEDVVVDYVTRAEQLANPELFGGPKNNQESMHFEGGANFDLPFKDWRGEVVGFYSTSENQTAGARIDIAGNPDVLAQFNPFGNGTAQNLELLEGLIVEGNFQNRRKTRSRSLTFNADGSLAEMDSGDLRAAFGVEYRVESLSQAGDFIADRNLSDSTPSQDIFGVSGEISVPVTESLIASFQGRYDKYDVNSQDPSVDGKSYSEFSPRITASWVVSDDLTIRGSWGESFKAPNLNNLVVRSQPGQFPSPMIDPANPGLGPVPVFFNTVPNPNLESESGETITVGLDWSPSFLDGFSASISYNDIEFDNQILGRLPLSTEEILANESQLPGVVERNASGVLTAINSFPANVAITTLQALDFDFRYVWSTDLGEFDASLDGTYTLSNEQAATDFLPLEELRASSSGADRWRAVASLGWSRENYGANLYANYTGSYRNTEAIDATSFNAFFGRPFVSEEARIPHHTTWDLTGYYNTDNGWKVSAGVRDLFNNKFPFYHAFAGPYDTVRVDLRGRLIHLEVQKSFDF